MVVFPLPCKRISNSPSSSAHISELRASRVFAWRSVPAVRCVHVLQQQLAPTALYTATHTHIRTHFLIMASAPPRQMLLFTLQKTTYEHPLGDIGRLKSQNRRQHRPPRHARPRPVRRRRTTAMCSPRRKPASSFLHGAACAHDRFRPFR